MAIFHGIVLIPCDDDPSGRSMMRRRDRAVDPPLPIHFPDGCFGDGLISASHTNGPRNSPGVGFLLKNARVNSFHMNSDNIIDKISVPMACVHRLIKCTVGVDWCASGPARSTVDTWI